MNEKQKAYTERMESMTNTQSVKESEPAKRPIGFNFKISVLFSGQSEPVEYSGVIIESDSMKLLSVHADLHKLVYMYSNSFEWHDLKSVCRKTISLDIEKVLSITLEFINIYSEK